MDRPDLPIELKTDFTDADTEYYVMVEDRLRDLAKGHSDMTGATVTLEHPAEGRETPPLVEATVVVYTRPNDISATEKQKTAKQALKGALDAVERQIRDKRERLRDDNRR